MEKNNTNVVDEVIEQVEKGERVKERAIKKIKKDNDIASYIADVFCWIIGLLIFLIILEVPDLVGYFYIDEVNPIGVVLKVLYVVILCVLLVRNYVTLRKINSK